METSPEENEEKLHGLKRKRSNSDGSNNESPHSECEDNIPQSYTENLDRCEEENSNKEKEIESLKPFKKPTSRKRKYNFNIDVKSPKKCKKFYYINKLMPKPRKPKPSQAVTEEVKKQEAVPGKKHKLHCVKTDSNGNLYLVYRSPFKYDMFFNDEKKCSYEPYKKLDLAFHVVDEIALEGLDGITIEAFWKRLKNVFPNGISKAMADRIWRLICNNKRVNFYILKEPREELVFFDRSKYLDLDGAMFLEPFIEFKDIYPYASVCGTEIRGSCSTFQTRKENNGVRKFSIDKAKKLYDQKLVFVADQALRNKALINEEADPNIELLDVEYCMLEKIGRTREQGEFTQGKMSSIHDGKSVYHNRKSLSQQCLIVHQNFYLKSFASQQNICGGLVHLSRFYYKRRSKPIAIMEKLAQLLRMKPNFQMEFTEFRKIFGQNVSLRRLLKSVEFRKFFKICVFPYRKLYPNASKQEYLRKSQHKERQIKVLRMIDPYANVTVLMDSKESKETSHEKSDSSSGSKLMNYEYLRDIFLYILSNGTRGVTVHEIYDHVKTDFYSVRMAVRKLLLKNVISSSKIDLGRQQSLKFFAKQVNLIQHEIGQPNSHQLTDETLARVLKSYTNKDQGSVTFYTEPEAPAKITHPQTQFKLEFEPFCCTAFLTETVDACSEELTIYDIVIKGRDKLLLIESNLFAHYMNEWEEYLLKKDDFSKGIQLFQNGFGKVIYDFLTTIKLSDAIEVDNHVVFSISNITPDTRIGRQFQTHRIINIPKNYTTPHSDSHYIDTISKIYIFEAMFNELHKNNYCIEKLKNVFERVMMFDGKRKLTTAETVEPDKIKIEVEVSGNIVMEKFMGPYPLLEWAEQEEDITIEMFSSTKPETVMQPGTMFNAADKTTLTQRYENRANLILKSVYEQKIVQDVRTLYKDILKDEDEEGYDWKACKKSIVSIVSKLVSDGYIKCFKLLLTGKNITRSQCFICVHEVDSRHSLIKTAMEQLKLKFYVGSSIQKTFTIKKKNDSPFSSLDVKESITELKQLTNMKTELDLKFDRTKGKVYGYAPKFVRMRVLHELLFHVIWETSESVQLSHVQIFEMCKTHKIKVSQSEITEMPPVFRNELGWKMFIPSLPQHTTWPKGWALACDIVLRMPLSIFVQLYNVSYEIPELEAFLNHPIKRHYLLKHLPANIRNILLHKRKYFHNIYEVICNLCYIGLLQLGPRSFKEKDQLFIYLNSKAALYDTCSSKPGYNQIEDKKYKKISFEFKSVNDVELFWSEMLRICMNTPLGKRKVLDGQLVTIEECSSKPVMVATLKAKTFQQAVENDTGKIPGDRRGSAGFDSSLWTYVKRNWAWQNQMGVESKLAGGSQSDVRKKEFEIPPPVPYSSIKQEIQRKTKYRKGKSFKKKKAKVKIFSKKKFVRKIVARRTKRVREYCDAIDRSIMKKNPGIRVEWSDEEDQLLRYCRIASVFLCPVFKKQFIPYNVLRDVIHRICPKSKNKTARAIQRRIYVLLTNDEVMKIMETNVENLLNSDTLSKYFEQIHNRYKTTIKISDSQIYICFVYLMSYICKHRKEVELLLLGCFASFDFFSDSNICDFEAILQNCEDTSTSPIYSNPKTVEDITKDTIKSIIHCSMACRKNSVGWTFYLSRIYKKFQDDVIRATVTCLRKDQFFVHNKSVEAKNDNAWSVPIKFSHVYNLMKTASYTVDMFGEVYRNFAAMVASGTDSEVMSFMDCNELNSFWEKTIFTFDIPEMGIILNPEIEDHSEVANEIAKRFNIYLDQIYKKNNGTNKTEKLLDDKENDSQEKNIDEVKDEVRHLIFRVPYLFEGNIETYFKKMVDSKSNLEINNYIVLMITDLMKFAQSCNTSVNLKKFIDAIENDNNVDDQQKLIKNLSKVVFAIQNIDQNQEVVNFDDVFTSWEIENFWESRHSDENKRAHKTLFTKNCTNGMESCIKRAQEGKVPSLEEIKEGIMAEIENAEERKFPHITDLIMLLNEDRFPELDTDIEALERMKDHFVMQYPQLNEFSIEDVELMQELEITRKIMGEEKIDQIQKKTENAVGTPQLDRIVNYIYENNGNKNDITITENLIDFIKSKKELGASPKELKEMFLHQIAMDLANLLQFLTHINVILRTGIASIVYVHHEYQSEWLTETFMLSPKEKEIFDLKQKQEIKKNLKSLIGERMQSSDPRKVQLKPWTKLDGSINDEVFREWLCIILSRCVDFPNIPFLTLCEHFHYIKPVDIYFLLEVLQEIGCVQIFLLSSVENCLFSKRCIVNENEATCLDNFEDMFIKSMNVSGLSFGSFLNKAVLR